MTKSLSAAAGEYLVLGELLKRKHMAFLAQGPNQVGWDIIIWDQDECPRIKTVQVKAVDWPVRKAVQLKTPFEFDYLVIVLLDRCNSQRSQFIILKNECVESLLSPVNKDRKDPKRTITLSEKLLKQIRPIMEDNWNILRPTTSST